MIRLIEPGGAGKSTVGSALARRLEMPFVDLDVELMARRGDISELIDGEGYEAYARANVETYRHLLQQQRSKSVVALSSGFMTYPSDIHPDYETLRGEVMTSPSTFVLLPSLDVETCVKETVRRQLERPFIHSARKEERVIRERFVVYASLPCPKIETMAPLGHVLEDLAARLQAHGAINGSG
ncbi:MAG: hypothetical protein KY429_00660 [Actinobacteria bacterium]|nr:hypothetical protein [Actinomycetota bacterium]